MVLFDIKDMDIVHPVSTVVAAKVVNLGVYKAACGGNTCTWLLASDSRFDPGEGACVKVEDIIELAILIWFTAKDIDLPFKGDG